MFSQRQILGSLAGLGIILGIASGVRANQISTHPANSTAQFRQVEQPLSLKIGVTAVGLSLIGLELWWFLFSKNQAKTQSASVKADPP
jgi:plastocyanin domain-containing protein